MKIKKILGLFFLVVCTCSVISFSVNAEEYEPVATTTWNGHVYAVYDVSMDWTGAEAHCISVGGHLVTITSEAEQRIIDNLITSSSKRACWIGGYKISDSWSWVTGENWDYTNWASGEPNNYQNRGEDVLITENGTWNDQLSTGDPTGITIDETALICEWDYEWNTGNSGITYFTPEEARAFIGFLYNTNHLTEEMLNSGDLYEFLTGQKQGSPDEEIYKRLFLATSYDLISKNIDSASSKANHGYDTLLNSLLELSNFSDDQTSVNVGISLGSIKTAFISTLSMALGADHAEVKAMDELFSGITDLAGLKGKASDIVTKFEACMGAAEMLNNAGYRDMYTYYMNNIEMKPIYGYSDDVDAVLDWVADWNKNTSVAGTIQAMIAKADFTGLTDKYNLNWTSDECISFLDKCADFTYMVEMSLDNTSVEEEVPVNQQNVITFDSNSDYSDDFTYVYTPEKNNWQIPELKRNGYTFDSWYWNEELTDLVNGIITIKDKMKFFAKWLPIFEFDIKGSTMAITKLNIKDKTIEIPNTIDGCIVEAIKKEAFEQCNDLNEITIPNNVISIDENAFEDCQNLIINGYKYSAAHYYAQENELPFVDIAPNVFLGDVTGDKIHDLSDFNAMVSSIIYETLPETQLSNTDINADGKISLNDLRLLMQIIAKENNITKSH